MHTATKNLLRCFTFAVVLVAGITVYAQAPSSNTFMRKASAPGMNGGLSLAVTSDGGFVGTGQQQIGSSAAGNCDVYAYKVDACGTIEWEKLYGDSGSDGGKYIQQTSDGGYIITGILGPSLLLLKLDAQGNRQWARTYNVGVYGLFVQETSDGGFIFSSAVSPVGFGGTYDIALIKTDANGNTQWAKVYGGAGDEWGDYVEQTNDGGYIVAGYTSSYGAGGTDLFLMKVNSSGTIQWNKTYGGAGNEGNSSWGISGQTTPDGGYMVSGNTDSYGAGSNDVLLVKTDGSGNLQWAKVYGGADDDQPRFAHVTQDNGYIICGLTKSFGHGDLDAYLIKTDVNGILKWSKAYGGPAYDKCQMVREASDGGYALSIITDNFGADGDPDGEYFDPLFMKTDSLGIVGCYEANCATIVSSVTPAVGTGMLEMSPTITSSDPGFQTYDNNSSTDNVICRHCTTVPTFVPSDTVVCVNDTLYFYNTTSVGIRCFEDWYVNGSVVSGDKDTLSFVFSTAGIHSIQLIASCGNSTDTNTINIHVIALPVASYTNTTVCENKTTVFTNTSTSPGTIVLNAWNFGDTSVDSTQSPSHTYADSGTYNATLIVQSSYGCRDTVSHAVHVNGLPTANFSFQNVCVVDSIHFTNLSSANSGSNITSYDWYFGDGGVATNTTTPTHRYASAGFYSVKLIVTTNNGCKDSISKVVTIHPQPNVQFVANNTCDEKPASIVQLTTIPTTDTIQNWLWNFGDGTQLNQQTVTGGHLYADTGSYTIKLIVTSTFGCIDSLSQPILVHSKPVANFGYTKVCQGTSTVFSDSSTTSTGTLNTWRWNFNDGSSNNLTQNPSHLYAAAGVHTATLISQNTFGCSDTVTKNVTVYFNPIANFTFSDVCLHDSLLFNDSSYVDTSASVNTFLWVFNDGSPTSAQQNPHHYYNTQGTYNVTLLSTTNQGCSNATSKAVHVFDPPASHFTLTNVCLIDSAIFTNTSTNPTIGSIASWHWDFGDGSSPNTSTLNPHHLYADTGSYTITLITRSSNLACADTTSNMLRVFPMPLASFSSMDVCFGMPVSFTDASTVDAPSNIASWSWNFGAGGSLSTLQNPTHTYSAYGTFNVSLIVTTNNTGCKDTATNTVLIHPLPEPSFTFTTICAGGVAQFTDASTVPTNTSNDAVFAWAWDFGNGSATSNNQNSSQQYLLAGMDTVELKVISSFGCADSITKTIIVNPNPVVDFTVSDTIGCEPLCLHFQDASSILSGSNISWDWDLGDSSSYHNISFNHCYVNDSVFGPISYSVSLTVTSDSGCITTLIKSNLLTVYPEPVASFTVEPPSASFANPIIDIRSTATGANFWQWNFGDSDTSTSVGPFSHEFADTGSYTIQLVVFTQYGCTDTSYKTIFIEPDFLFYIPSAFTPNGDGVNDTFIPKGTFVSEFEMMIFDRWGNLVYQTNDFTKPWDGKINHGANIGEADVYVYSIKVTDVRYEKHTYKGKVSLVR